MTLRSIPNAITVARLVMAPPLLWLLLGGHYLAALWLAMLAGLSDALDGFLARRFGWRSILGGILDPIADKLLMSVCFFGLWWTGNLPTWLVAVVLVRDLVILVGAFFWWRLKGAFEAAPSGISKMTTLVQITLIVLVLAHLAGTDLALSWLPPLLLATAAMTLASGVDYVVRYGLLAWHVYRSKQ
jgi:cardiolipin synthase